MKIIWTPHGAPEGTRPGPPGTPDVKIEKSSKPSVVGSFLKDNFMLNPKITVPFGCVWLDLLIFELEVRNIWPFAPAGPKRAENTNFELKY